MRENSPSTKVSRPGEAFHQRLAAGDGFGIAVDAQHLAIGRFQNRLGVTAAAEGAVDIVGAIPGRQSRDHFRQHHRDVFAGKSHYEFSSRARASLAFIRATASASTGP